MFEESQTPPGPFSLRPPTKGEAAQQRAAAAAETQQRRRAQAHYTTSLILYVPGSDDLKTTTFDDVWGWVVDAEQPDANVVTLTRVRGPDIPREQWIATKGFTSGIEERLAGALEAAATEGRTTFKFKLVG